MEKIKFKDGKGRSRTMFQSNGQWRCDIWNPRRKRSEAFYFGTVADDPKAHRALHDPVNGFYSRQAAIEAGTDHLGTREKQQITLGDLVHSFMQFQHEKLLAGRLSPLTYADYDNELTALVKFMGQHTVAEAIGADQFDSYRRELVNTRKLGPHRLATVIRYVRALFNHGRKTGKIPAPVFGEFTPPDTDPDAIALQKERRGEDDQEWVFDTAHIEWLLERATPLFKAMILLSLNCGLGPADLGRLKWKHLDLEEGRLSLRRGKRGIRREAYLWKKTRRALERVRTLKHNQQAIEREGEEAHVFLTRNGVPVVRVEKQMKGGRVVGVKASNAVSSTFSRWIKEAKGAGVIPAKAKLGYYDLRRKYYTEAENHPDLNAVSRTMGHALHGVGRRYKRKPFPLPRLRRVAMKAYRSIWPRPKPTNGKHESPRLRLVV